MISETVQNVFVRIYCLLLLNFYFLAFSVLGLGLFGVGPAARMVVELYLDANWDYQELHFKSAWAYFKQYFWLGNAEAWSVLGILLVFAYNLWLSTQLTGLWVLLIQFILLFAMVMTAVIALYWLATQSQYDVGWRDALTLSIAQFFQNFPTTLLTIGGLVVILAVTRFFPGLLAFLTFAVLLLWPVWRSKRWFAHVDDLLAGKK